MPFNDSSNPCKLMCILPGQKPEEKAIAIDGTPCLSSGICVDGTCVVSYYYKWRIKSVLHMPS